MPTGLWAYDKTLIKTNHTRIKVGPVSTYWFERISWPQTRWANSILEVYLKKVVSADKTAGNDLFWHRFTKAV